MRVLSLFNGCSGAYMALNDLGITVDKYYSSEVDKFANQAATLINPDTIHLGDVTKWREWDIEWDKIDLIAAGSPCQGFSFAGKQLAFDDPRSSLFFVFIDIVNHCKEHNPKMYYFLENVIMKKEHMKVINEYTGIIGQRLNSNLVSAQNRDRMYWTNISTIKVGLFSEEHTYVEPPFDRGILLKDTLQPESEVDEKYYIKNPKFEFEGMKLDGKANTQRTGGSCSQTEKHNYDIISVVNDKKNLREVKKASCLDANYHKGIDNHAARTAVCVAMRGRNNGTQTKQTIEPNKEGNTNCITSVQKDNLIIQRGRGFNKGGIHEEKSPTLTQNAFEQNNHVYKDHRLRRLTPKETMQLQTLPDHFQKILLESGISDTQLYRMIGNGWTIEIIKEYFKQLK